MSNRELAAAVIRLRIDILVDLNGYSFQKRFGLFMRRPARVIIVSLSRDRKPDLRLVRLAVQAYR
jgi:predicted O-linked N-acetylglucosamine transferase (SPINDLY family)